MKAHRSGRHPEPPSDLRQSIAPLHQPSDPQRRQTKLALRLSLLQRHILLAGGL